MSKPACPLMFTSAHHPVLGRLWVAATNQRLTHFSFGLNEKQFLNSLSQDAVPVPPNSPSALTLSQALTQVQEYLSGERQKFTVDIDWRQFNAFQSDVYRAVLAIPYGQTRTYSQVAGQIERPNAARAVGAANGSNPLPIIIPCHRLVGKDGSLRGYGGAGGIQTKQWLLDHEKQVRDRSLFPQR